MSDTIQIVQCYSCGEQHGAVQLQPYVKPSPPWTHWFCCPTNGDPVPLTLIYQENQPEQAVELNRRVVSDFAKAYGNGRWLAAIFFVDGDKVYSGINASEWPHKEYETALALLQQHAEKHGGLPKPEPLPRAARSVKMAMPAAAMGLTPPGAPQAIKPEPVYTERPIDNEGSAEPAEADATA